MFISLNGLSDVSEWVSDDFLQTSFESPIIRYSLKEMTPPGPTYVPWDTMLHADRQPR